MMPTMHTFDRIDAVRPSQLEGDDIGALDPGEIGFIGRCSCGWRTHVRYSAVSARKAVAAHADPNLVLTDNYAMGGAR